jgi:hypothetical protein
MSLLPNWLFGDYEKKRIRRARAWQRMLRNQQKTTTTKRAQQEAEIKRLRRGKRYAQRKKMFPT